MPADTPGAPAPDILCVMRLPPDLDGHGGSQRAWHLVQGLAAVGRVHFVLVFRQDDVDCTSTSLAPLAPLVASVTRINIAGWRCTHGKQLGVFHPGVWELARMRSHEAPLLGRAERQLIAQQMPLRKPDIIFAGRLCSAVIVQALIDDGLLTCARRVVDFDDVMSRFRARQLRNAGAAMGRQGRVLARLDAAIIARAERRIARLWDGISVCTREDTQTLRTDHPAAHIVKIPNAVHRTLLPPRPSDGTFRILFTGNLGFPPNQDGLRVFLDAAWPIVRETVPDARLSVVGLNPPPDVAAMVQDAGGELHANVPRMDPYYQACDVVIAPILFGSGTRIKILEAMAFGRAVVATPLGAEGMELEDGRHVLLAATMPAFAQALIRLAREPGLRETLVEAAHRFQQRYFGPAAIKAGVASLLQSPREAAVA